MTVTITSDELWKFVFFFCIEQNTPTTTEQLHKVNILTFCMSIKRVALKIPYNDTIHWRCLVDEKLRQFLPCIDDCSFVVSVRRLRRNFDCEGHPDDIIQRIQVLAIVGGYMFLLCRPHNEKKLKQNGFKTVLKLFCFSFISLCERHWWTACSHAASNALLLWQRGKVWLLSFARHHFIFRNRLNKLLISYL